MPIELEAKFKVDRLDAIEARLLQTSAVFENAVEQQDTYFDYPDGALLQADSGLRIRCEESLSNPNATQAVLCYKGPRLSGPYKQREEIETRIDNQAAREILRHLGLVVRLDIKKYRRHWRLNNCLVCLDEVNQLGCFVEIEGPDEPAIKLVIDILGLSSSPMMKTGYARMLSDKLKSQQAIT